jgi:hypothetical protein
MFDAFDFGAVQGMYHRKRKIACQDAVRAAIQDEHAVLVCADGADQSKHSALAAASIVSFLLPRFLAIAPGLLRAGTSPASIDLLVQQLIEARRDLNIQYPETDFEALKTTFLACLVGPDRLCFVHLGDGLACAIAEDQGLYRFVSSEPENGIDLSTTYALSDSNWFRHLRIAMFEGQFIFAACMSDGAQALFQDEKGFAIRRLVELAIVPEDDPHHIEAFLDTALARLLSDDDKSLCYVRSKAVETYLNHLIKTQREVLAYPSSRSLEHATQVNESRASHRHVASRMLRFAQGRLSQSKKSKRMMIVFAVLAAMVTALIIVLANTLVSNEPEEVRAIKKLIEQSKK